MGETCKMSHNASRTLLWTVVFQLFVGITAVFCQERAPSDESYWPHWRGPLLTGVSPHAKPPIEWNEKNQQNIRWKIPLPGKGHSSPVVWGDLVFVTAAVPYGEKLEPIYDNAPGSHDNVPVTHHHQFVIYAVNRADGTIAWERTLKKELPHEGGHHTGSLASNSPVTDGEHVFAFFGSRGLYCLDMKGEVVWEKDLGRMQTLHGHGEGSSPLLYGNMLIINWDHEGQSFVEALDKHTGDQIWKVLRNEVTSWASPIIADHNGKPQLVISGTDRVRGYDLATGDELWQCGGLSANVVATPVAGGGIVFAGSSYDKRALMAIKLEGASGDVTGSQQVLWSRSRGTPYVPSPLLYDTSLYYLTHYQGIMTKIDGPSGEDQPGAFRLPQIGDVYASPVGADGRVYVTDRDGATIVFTHEEVPRLLALNQLDDTVSATAAPVGSELLIRGERFLYCIAEKGS